MDPDSQGAQGSSTQERINYSSVRTNWSGYPPGSIYEAVMVTKRQVVSGVLSIPLKRCLNIFGALHEQVACMDGATGLSLVRMVSPFSLDDGQHESHVDEYRGGGQEQAMEMQQPKKKNNNNKSKNDGCVVLWNADCTKGYQAHMRRYTSQPTQVFLQSLHACFDEMHVRPWSVLCFVPLGVQGHCQLVVWHDGHPHHRAFKSSIVHGWTHQRIEDDDHVQTHDALDVPKPHALPIKTCIQEDGHGEVACTVDGQFVLQDMCDQDVVIVTPAAMPKLLMNAKNKKKRKKKNTKSTEHRTENDDDGATEENMRPLYCNSSSKDQSSIKKTLTHSLSTENTHGRKRSRKPSKPSQGHQM